MTFHKKWFLDVIVLFLWNVTQRTPCSYNYFIMAPATPVRREFKTMEDQSAVIALKLNNDWKNFTQ